MATPTEHLDMEPRASDFVELLRDLGHLDDAAMERLTEHFLRSRSGSAPITYDDARRAAAVLLFDAEDGLRPESRELLSAEWTRLFG
jgi:hypothetical protein